jgi:cysteine desulfurase / selenocysteine lyase
VSTRVATDTALDVARIRADFPILERTVGTHPLVYLDSAATSQKPKAVVDTIDAYYANTNANVHRGVHTLGNEATDAFENARARVAAFIDAPAEGLVFVRNTTEAINLVASSYATQLLEPGDRIVVTVMEHHSNIVPWQMLAKRKGVRLDYAGLEEGKFVDMEDYKRKLELRPKLVSFTHVSNVLGTINEAKEMTRLAHKAGATVLVDAAQSVPHLRVDVREIGCDFMAFSAHKMLGPSGVGVLYGRESLLEGMPPFLGGGDMIRTVGPQESTWNELPWKFEAGTQNIEGAIGFGAAIKYLERIGLANVRKHEMELTRYALERLGEDRKVEVYGPGLEDVRRKAGVIAFNVEGAPSHDVASIFDSEGVAIRTGHHCAMPLVRGILHQRGGVPRMSFYIYNTEGEIDRAISAIGKVRKVLRLK